MQIEPRASLLGLPPAPIIVLVAFRNIFTSVYIYVVKN
jgi:hypothetical protein